MRTGMMVVECCGCHVTVGVKPAGESPEEVSSTMCPDCMLAMYPEHYQSYQDLAPLYAMTPEWSQILRFAGMAMEVAA